VTLDCQRCGACCYGPDAYVGVTNVDLDGMTRQTRSKMIVRHGDRRYLRMLNGHCAALRARAGHFACRMYAERPLPCRVVEAGSRECLLARERRGISDGS
jgi:Fe-S-cluster containining protein